MEVLALAPTPVKTFCGRLTEARRSIRPSSQIRNGAKRSLATMLSGTITPISPPGFASRTNRSVNITSIAVLARRRIASRTSGRDVAAERRIACDHVESTFHYTARRVVQEPIRHNHLGIAQQRVLSPATCQGLVNVGSEETFER